MSLTSTTKRDDRVVVVNGNDTNHLIDVGYRGIETITSNGRTDGRGATRTTTGAGRKLLTAWNQTTRTRSGGHKRTEVTNGMGTCDQLNGGGMIELNGRGIRNVEIGGVGSCGGGGGGVVYDRGTSEAGMVRGGGVFGDGRSELRCNGRQEGGGIIEIGGVRGGVYDRVASGVGRGREEGVLEIEGVMVVGRTCIDGRSITTRSGVVEIERNATNTSALWYNHVRCIEYFV